MVVNFCTLPIVLYSTTNWICFFPQVQLGKTLINFVSLNCSLPRCTAILDYHATTHDHFVSPYNIICVLACRKTKGTFVSVLN
jgi:hypothetical protein